MPDFIPGLELARLFYLDGVKPLLHTNLPGLQYSAALLGSGSEILGFDTEMSADHHWGPRVMLFLKEADRQRYSQLIDEKLRNGLPTTFLGYSTNFSAPDPLDNNVQLLADVDMGPVNHRVEIHSPRKFILEYLDFDIDQSIEAADWLTFPSQKLRSLTSGAVYHDDIGLQTIRDRFSYYPHEVWLYLLASGWNRIGQEEHLMGRAGLVGDEVGSTIIAARLVRDLMQLCFLMEKQYAPYSKWFGTAFAQLQCASELVPLLTSVLEADNWKAREQHLAGAYEYVAELHNRLEITGPLATKVTNFFGRPFLVMHLGARQADAIRARITDPDVKRIVDRGLIGSIDQFSDSVDILSNTRWRARLRQLYE